MRAQRIRPRTQGWATWMLAFAPTMFAVLAVAKDGGLWIAAMDQWGHYAFVAASICAVLSPLGWLLLRRIPSFRVPPRTHALQVSVWFLGWILAPLIFVVLSL